MEPDNNYNSDNEFNDFDQSNENPFVEPNQQEDSTGVTYSPKDPYEDFGYQQDLQENDYIDDPYIKEDQNSYIENPYSGEIQPVYTEDSNSDDDEKRKKILTLIAILLAAIVVAVSLFFVVRAFSNKKDHNKARFERKERGEEPSNLGILPIPDKTDSSEKPHVTVSEETSKSRRPSKMPSLTTRETSKQTTTKREIKISEQTRQETTTTSAKPSGTTTAKIATDPTTTVTTTKKMTQSTTPNVTVTKETTRPTTKATQTKQTTQPTESQTATATTEKPTESKTDQTTNKPTEEPTQTSTEPTQEPQVEFPEPSQVPDYPKLPEGITPNPDLPSILSENESDMVISQDGKFKAEKTALSDHSFSVINDKGEEIVFEEVEHTVDEIVAVSKSYVYFASGNQLIRMSVDDKAENEINGLTSLSTASYQTDLSENLIVINEQTLHIVPAESTEAIKIGSDLSDIKLQGNTLAYLAKGNLYLVDLKNNIESNVAKEIPQNGLSNFALTVDGSAVYLQKENSLYCYKAGLLYQVSSDIKDYRLMSDGEHALILENNDQLNIVKINGEINLIKAVQNVDGATLTDNRMLNYNGNYSYIDRNSELTIYFLDGTTQNISY